MVNLKPTVVSTSSLSNSSLTTSNHHHLHHHLSCSTIQQQMSTTTTTKSTAATNPNNTSTNQQPVSQSSSLSSSSTQQQASNATHHHQHPPHHHQQQQNNSANNRPSQTLSASLTNQQQQQQQHHRNSSSSSSSSSHNVPRTTAPGHHNYNHHYNTTNPQAHPPPHHHHNLQQQQQQQHHQQAHHYQQQQQKHHHGQQPRPPHHNNPQQQQHQQQFATHHKTTTSNAASNESESAAASNIDFKLFESIEYPFCTDHSKYEHIAKIGQGTFGEVYKAKCKKTNEIVALKKVLTENEKEGFPITALREIKILQVLQHENIVRLIEICTTKASASNKYKSQFYLVFEFCEHDLAGLLSTPTVKFSLGEQKKIMQQLLNGLYFIHKNFILHRDMKTANILVTKEGKLKLADFGLARAVVQSEIATRYTNRVVTLWYRPPELLLGEKCYNKAIDIWGSGCIMAELWTREPILKGNSEQNQLDLITTLCGSITPEVWPEVEKLELFNKMHLKTDLKRRIKERLGNHVKDHGALDLLERLLTLDPKKRIDSDEALDHDFFWTEPLPVDLKLDKFNSSMFEYTSQHYKRGQYRQPNKPIANDQHYDRVY